jgi:hypothetical protein
MFAFDSATGCPARVKLADPDALIALLLARRPG